MPKTQIIVTGEVQGVGFRYSAQEKADELGLVLRQAENRPDGSVFLLAEGEESALQKFIAWAKIGPPLARVDKVEVI